MTRPPLTPVLRVSRRPLRPAGNIVDTPAVERERRGGFRSRSGRDLCALALMTMLALWVAAAASPALADPDAAPPPVNRRAPEVRLTGNTVTLPIVMVREYPFVEASIAGVAGKLMLDTGFEAALTVNDHRVPVTNGRTIGSGFFGSGETFEIRLAAELRDVRIGELSYPSVTDVQAQDARMLEGITPDFLGWLGHHAFASHALKLDYRSLQATFYPQGGPDYLAGERVIAELPFETRRLPNHPIVAGRIGEMAVVTTWDTGQFGVLNTTDDGKARLLAEGRLKPSLTELNHFDLHGLEINGHAMPVVLAIEVETTSSASARSVGITEPHELTIGYGLLRQFKTVWDYSAHRLYLLEP